VPLAETPTQLLSPAAQGALDHITAPDAEPDAVMTLVVPFGVSPSDRARLIDEFSSVVAELRQAGWTVNTTTNRAENGEALTLGIEPRATPTEGEASA
jgi:hypothetical protein